MAEGPAPRPRVFVSHPLVPSAMARLEEEAAVVVGGGDAPFEGGPFLEGAPRFDGFVTLLTARVTGPVLDLCPRLRVVANVAVGVDNVDLAACRARGVVVTHTPGVLTDATADLAFGLLLAAARRIAEGDRFVRGGLWRGWSPTLMLGARVHGATLGIVGMGRIGQAMARRARGFGMSVVYAQRTPLAADAERDLGARKVPLDDLFATSDFVSLHCPLTAETRHLVSAARLARMRPRAILVNTARGPCVDEAALAHALAHGPLGAAALDVFEDEPRVLPALLQAPNVVLSPHIASAEGETRAAMAHSAVEGALAVLRGEAPRHRVQ